jgi:hypothetical protein
MIRRTQVNVAAILVAVVALTAPSAGAQTGSSSGRRAMPMVGAPPPPPPEPPATVSRNAEGGVSVRAVRIAEPIKVDGKLDEDLYRDSGHQRLHPAGSERGRAGDREDRGLGPL